MTDFAVRPNRIPWPPLVFVAAVLAAWAAGHALPLGAVPEDPAIANAVRLARGLGWLLIAAGLALDLAAMLTMHRQRANILPHRAATALVTSGPFAVSRNPIYLGNTLVLFGAAGAFANPWFIPAAVLAAWVVQVKAIRREEAHLAARFGAAWAAYARRTPRWLGF